MLRCRPITLPSRKTGLGRNERIKTAREGVYLQALEGTAQTLLLRICFRSRKPADSGRPTPAASATPSRRAPRSSPSSGAARELAPQRQDVRRVRGGVAWTRRRKRPGRTDARPSTSERPPAPPRTRHSGRLRHNARQRGIAFAALDRFACAARATRAWTIKSHS
jgi:hypothetical protein